MFPEAGFLCVALPPLSIIFFSLDGGLLFEPNWSHTHRHPLALPGQLDKSVQQALHPAKVFFFSLIYRVCLVVYISCCIKNDRIWVFGLIVTALPVLEVAL